MKRWSVLFLFVAWCSVFSWAEDPSDPSSAGNTVTFPTTITGMRKGNLQIRLFGVDSSLKVRATIGDVSFSPCPAMKTPEFLPLAYWGTQDAELPPFDTIRFSPALPEGTKIEVGRTLSDSVLSSALVGPVSQEMEATIRENRKKLQGQEDRKACLAGLRTILRSYETFNIDRVEKIGDFDPEAVQTLIEAGYVKKAPACNASGVISLYSYAKEGKVSCSVHGPIWRYEILVGCALQALNPEKLDETQRATANSVRVVARGERAETSFSPEESRFFDQPRVKAGLGIFLDAATIPKWAMGRNQEEFFGEAIMGFSFLFDLALCHGLVQGTQGNASEALRIMASCYNLGLSLESSDSFLLEVSGMQFRERAVRNFGVLMRFDSTRPYKEKVVKLLASVQDPVKIMQLHVAREKKRTLALLEEARQFPDRRARIFQERFHFPQSELARTDFPTLDFAQIMTRYSALMDKGMKLDPQSSDFLQDKNTWEEECVQSGFANKLVIGIPKVLTQAVQFKETVAKILSEIR